MVRRLESAFVIAFLCATERSGRVFTISLASASLSILMPSASCEASASVARLIRSSSVSGSSSSAFTSSCSCSSIFSPESNFARSWPPLSFNSGRGAPAGTTGAAELSSNPPWSSMARRFAMSSAGLSWDSGKPGKPGKSRGGGKSSLVLTIASGLSSLSDISASTSTTSMSSATGTVTQVPSLPKSLPLSGVLIASSRSTSSCFLGAAASSACGASKLGVSSAFFAPSPSSFFLSSNLAPSPGSMKPSPPRTARSTFPTPAAINISCILVLFMVTNCNKAVS
mmetsp:Transcript_109998/g.328846  ORF Transcript_109998/g.328846 Transcript_109998/m.328846 type:complete len:283 (-) Transcript_109998:898-1746(-)